MWGAKPRGHGVPGFLELLGQVGSDKRVFKVIIFRPVDAKLLVVRDQSQDGLKALGCFELSFSTPTLPRVDCEQLQGVLGRQRLPKLLLTLRREQSNMV